VLLVNCSIVESFYHSVILSVSHFIVQSFHR